MKLSIALLSLLAPLLMLDFHIKVDACSCQPTHPQDLFCQAEFVVKALVGRARLVELDTNGDFEYVKDKKKTKNTGEDAGSGEEVNKNGRQFQIEFAGGEPTRRVKIMNDDEIVRPAPVITHGHLRMPNRGKLPLGPDSRMPGYKAHFVGIRGSHSETAHAPGTAGNSDLEVQRQRRGAGSKPGFSRRLNRPRRVGGAPGINTGFATPSKRLMMQYKIDIVKTFKGLENVTKERKNFLYTPPAPLCNVRLSTARSPHILMGKVQDGVLLMRACDYKLDLSEISEEEARNLVRNMHFRFKAGCLNCHIKVCNRGGCGPQPSNPYQCLWRDWMTTGSPLASQFACIRTRGGKCKWYNGNDKSMKPEDISAFSPR